MKLSQSELSNKANKLVGMKYGIGDNDRIWLNRLLHYEDKDYYGAFVRSKKQREVVEKIVKKYNNLLPT